MNKELPVYKNVDGKYIRQFIEPNINCILGEIKTKDYVGQAWVIINPEDVAWLTSDIKEKD